MLASILALSATITVGMTSAIPNANVEVITARAPEIPEGFFIGYNNDDGTTTLDFQKINKTVTFEGTTPPSTVTRRDDGTGLEKRAPYGHSSCWNNPTLSRSGVDKGINAFRGLFKGKPNERGYLGSKWSIQYFGYNFDGVYVYFCANTKDRNYSDSFELADLEFALYWMDQDCGHYRPGYYQWDSPSLWGKCASGTRVCLA